MTDQALRSTESRAYATAETTQPFDLRGVFALISSISAVVLLFAAVSHGFAEDDADIAVGFWSACALAATGCALSKGRHPAVPAFCALLAIPLAVPLFFVLVSYLPY
ncbi:hypothetical protein OG216_28120 [Streptomycetaceae bacterium NBC_01309]